MIENIKLPTYAKAVLLLIGAFVLTTILYIAQEIIVPFVFASIVAIAISPVINYMMSKKINRSVSISIVLLVFLILFSILVVLIGTQAGLLRDALPELTNKLHPIIDQIILWASRYFHISTRKINAWLNNSQNEMLNNSILVIGSTLTTMSGMLSAVFLTPVYIFMLLYYQSHLIQFTHKIFGRHNKERVIEILSETKSIVQSYMAGIGIEFFLVAVLNTLGLLLLGIHYAVLLGILGALLNIIPYIGGIVGVAIFMMIALVVKSPIYVVYVALMYSVIQLIDNNYIVPLVIGSKVKLNGLFSLLAVIAGAALWGIPGMFLSIPLIAIVKLICDRIEPFKPYGFLMGENV